MPATVGRFADSDTDSPLQSLSSEEVRTIDAYWRAANYLSVGQIYLLDNPLLREPLRPEHVKPRLPGHWGTTPGLDFIYVHVNRAIKRHDLDAIYVTGPGHGGPGMMGRAARRNSSHLAWCLRLLLEEGRGKHFQAG